LDALKWLSKKRIIRKEQWLQNLKYLRITNKKEKFWVGDCNTQSDSRRLITVKAMQWLRSNDRLSIDQSLSNGVIRLLPPTKELSFRVSDTKIMDYHIRP
jgi:hypothetical protein